VVLEGVNQALEQNGGTLLEFIGDEAPNFGDGDGVSMANFDGFFSTRHGDVAPHNDHHRRHRWKGGRFWRLQRLEVANSWS